MPGHRPKLTNPQSLQLRSPVVIVTGQHKPAVDAGLGNELGQKRCGELHSGTGRALHHHLSDGAPVIAQVLMRRDVDTKFKSLHSGNPSELRKAVSVTFNPAVNVGIQDIARQAASARMSPWGSKFDKQHRQALCLDLIRCGAGFGPGFKGADPNACQATDFHRHHRCGNRVQPHSL